MSLCHHLALVVALVSSVLGARSAAAEPPRVISTTPSAGANAVDPTLPELRVRFDRDMDTTSFSWTGGGATFPGTRGAPRWISPRECALPVRLEPGRAYVVGVNGPRHHNFRGRDGVPAAPVVLRFATAALARAPSPPAAADHRAAADVLRSAIDTRYAHRDRLAIDWDAQFRSHAVALEHAASPRAFALAAARLLAPARDLHLWLEVGGERIATHRAPASNDTGLDERMLAREVARLSPHGPCVASGLVGELGYLLIRSWDPARCPALEADLAAAAALVAGRPVILDVRPNRGGDEMLARRFAGRFVARPVVYARHRVRAPGAVGGFTAPVDRVLLPAGVARPPRVAVLTSAANMSSAESFILMMRAAGAKLVGARTAGSSGNPRPVDLGNGVVLRVPSWQALLPDGASLEGVGIAPDVAVGPTTARRDPAIRGAAAALAR